MRRRRRPHLGDTEFTAPEQRHGPFDAARHEVGIRRFAVGQPKLAAQVPGRDIRAASEDFDVKRTGVLTVDAIAHTTQPFQAG